MRLTTELGLPRELIAQKVQSLFPQGCQRILLVVPPFAPKEDFSIEIALDNRYPVYPPYGFGVLRTELLRRGYMAEILDTNFDLQAELRKRKHNFEYDVWKEWVRDRIIAFKPDLVGLTCMFTVTYREMRRIAEFIKSNWPNLPVIAGGVHVTSASQLIFKDCSSIDLISLYEGNTSFGDLVDFTNGRIGADKLTQLASMIDGKYLAITERAPKTETSVNIIPDYQDLKIADYSRFGRIGQYHWLWREGVMAGTSLSTIGCRAQCTFCSVRSFNGRGVTTRSISNVVDELEQLRDRYGIRHFMWLDDDLLYDARRAIKLFDEMTKRKLGMTWDASNGIIASAMTEAIAESAAASGCIALSIGIESGNAEILKSVKKPSGLRHFYRCAEILKSHPQIFAKGLLMVGFPGETIGMMQDTVKLGVDIDLNWYTIQPLNFIPGVEITNHALIAGVVTEKQMLDGTERPFLGATGRQKGREQAERTEALQFVNLLEGNPERIPSRDEIKDIWMVMDWKVNYERLLALHDLIKLEMLEKLFINICDHTYHTNALGNLYFAIIQLKLGRLEEARKRLALARRYSFEVAYWRKRFEVLELDGLLLQFEREVSEKPESPS